MQKDKILGAFLERQYADGMALAASSDIFTLLPVDSASPPTRYLMEFDCRGLICVDGEVTEANHFVVGLSFPPSYLRRPVDPGRLLTWMHPPEIWHPNCAGLFICIGEVGPGTGIVHLAYQVYEVVSYQKLTPVESDALNRAACSWARRNMDRFPIDARPLKRPAPAPHVERHGEEEHS